MFNKKKIQKDTKRFIKRKRVLRRWKSWSYYISTSKIAKCMPLWKFSKERYKSNVRVGFFRTNLSQRKGSCWRRKPRRFRFLKFKLWRRTPKRYKRSLFLQVSSKRPQRRGVFRRFVLPHHSTKTRLLKYFSFRFLSRNRKFFNTYKYTRIQRVLLKHVKLLKRAVTQKAAQSYRNNSKLLLRSRYNSFSPFKKRGSLLLLPNVISKNRRPIKSPKALKLRKYSKFFSSRRNKVRASSTLKQSAKFYYSLVWNFQGKTILNNVSPKALSYNFTLNQSLDTLYMLESQGTPLDVTLAYQYPTIQTLVFKPVMSTLLNRDATILEFLRKFKATSQLIPDHHQQKTDWFQNNRLAQVHKNTEQLVVGGGVFTAPTQFNAELDAPLEPGLNSTKQRRLVSKEGFRKRRRPRQRGRLNNRRLTKLHHQFSLPNNSNRVEFLSRYNYNSNLNKLFIRVARIKITHYRLTTREFFSQYLTRLNPRHITYKTVNYVHMFQGDLLKKFFNPTKRFKLNRPQANTSGSLYTDQLGSLSQYVGYKAAHLQSYDLSYDKKLCGLFNFVNHLQNEYLFTGYWNSNKRKRKQKRRKWQFKRVLIRNILNISRVGAPIQKQKNRIVIPLKVHPSSPEYRSIYNDKSTLLNDLLTFNQVVSNPTYLLNYLSFPLHLPRESNRFSTQKNLGLHFSEELGKQFFGNKVNIYNTSNLIPRDHLSYHIKHKVLKLFKFHKFSKNVVMWYYTMLIRFMEFCSGKKIYIKFNPFLENYLTLSDAARCSVWSIRVRGFQKILGPKIFLDESLKIVCLSLRYKDPTFLSNWLRGMLNRMDFWKYRLLFRYLKFLLRYLFYPYFNELGFKGLKLRLKGKISVAGNARTRTLRYAIGETSYSQFNHRVVSDFSTINTFTGVLGFRIWLFF